MKYPSLLLLLLLVTLVSSEEVCKFSYKNDPAGLDKKRLELPHGAVAMSEFVHINNESSVIQTGGSSSIFFVIDNSNSMFIKDNGSGNPKPLGFDIDGARYVATSALIDSIYAISPGSSVGLSLFSSHLYFDPNDDALFKTLNVYKDEYKIQGGFVPLLKLNEVVTEGKYSGMTGYEALKDILKVKVFTGRKILTYLGTYLDIPTYTNLEYEPTNKYLDPVKINDINAKSGTNIWSGFAAAKEAMINSPHSNDNQHVIFYSDGNYSIFDNEGPHSFDWVDETADNTPTTYTVFFDEDNVVTINSLTKFKDKIKNNNYSQSNINSDLWAISAGNDVLVNLFMDNVIKEVITSVKSIVPKNIIVKGLNPVTSWDGDGFLFNSEFPLIGETTPIEYSIDYEIWFDSIVGSDTIKIKDKDTSLSFSYDAVIMDNPATPDSCILSWWGRTMSLQENGMDLTLIEDRTGNIDIVFNEYKVDTLYGYDNIEIVVTTGNGDREVVVLNTSGNISSGSIPRKVGAANIGDGEVQYDAIDNLVFKFANPNLPLDTLEMSVEANAQGMYVIKNIVYKDVNADGLLDRVKINVSGDNLSENSQLIINNITFPTERNITVNNVSVTGNDIVLEVTEQSGVIRTAIESFDKYTINDTIVLKGDAILAPFNLTAIDSIAPVIISASLVDSVKDGAEDFLTIEYSEESQNVDQNTCLAFYKNGTGIDISVSLSHVSTTSETVVYLVTSHGIESGDSVNIKSDNNSVIKDEKGNSQSNSGNRKVEIDVTLIEDKLYIVSASFHDKNADGWVDKILVNLSKNIDGLYANSVEQSIDFGISRSFTVTSTNYNNGIFEFTVGESGSEQNTSTELDFISINDSLVISAELILTPCTVSVNDSMAPVVLRASLIDSVKAGAFDYLTVHFSENSVDVSGENSLKFYEGAGQTPYLDDLEFISNIGNRVEYRIVDSKIKEGDSLNINNDNSIVIKDVLDNEQLNKSNRKVEIDVTIVEDNLCLVGSAFYDENADGFVDKVSLTLNQNVDSELVDDIVGRVDFGAVRSFMIQLQNYSSRLITLLVIENSDEMITSTAGERISINDSLKISEELVLIPCEVAVDDSMAPVIVEAHLYDSVITETKGKETYISEKGEDYITIACSEDLKEVKGSHPFKFHRGNSFDVAIEVLSVNGSVAECRVVDRNIIRSGDSVSVYYSSIDSVSDLLDLAQRNSENRRCPIDITIIEAQSFVPADIEFILKSTILDYTKTVNVPENWETEEGKSGIEKGVMIITLEPEDKANFTSRDDIIAYLSIYDNLGNLINSDLEMSFDQENKASHLLWSGKNSHGRLVGSGAYVIMAELRRYFDGELLPLEAIKKTVGVKCSKK